MHEIAARSIINTAENWAKDGRAMTIAHANTLLAVAITMRDACDEYKKELKTLHGLSRTPCPGEVWRVSDPKSSSHGRAGVIMRELDGSLCLKIGGKKECKKRYMEFNSDVMEFVAAVRKKGEFKAGDVVELTGDPDDWIVATGELVWASADVSLLAVRRPYDLHAPVLHLVEHAFIRLEEHVELQTEAM